MWLLTLIAPDDPATYGLNGGQLLGRVATDRKVSVDKYNRGRLIKIRPLTSPNSAVPMRKPRT